MALNLLEEKNIVKLKYYLKDECKVCIFKNGKEQEQQP